MKRPVARAGMRAGALAVGVALAVLAWFSAASFPALFAAQSHADGNAAAASPASAVASAPPPSTVASVARASAVASAPSARALASAPPASASASASPTPAELARGAYLAKVGDCAGCHTAPQGGAPYAGGQGIASPFGTIMSSNITPDPVDGIGRYTYEDFVRAVREGVAPGGKRLYPAMPYASFARTTDDDMRALYAYMLHGVAPVAKPAPRSDVAFPFNQRWALRFWQALFLPRGAFQARAERDAQWNRGAYLVQTLGHCGACHTPRGLGYQQRGYDQSSASYLTGAVNDHWFAPNLTGDAGSGLGRIGAADLAAFLKTGHGAGTVAFGSMTAQVENSTQYLSDDDLNAIARYLKSLSAQQPSGTYTPQHDVAREPVNGNRVPDPLSVGFNVYRSFCARCHQDDGTGVPQVFPALAGNPAVLTEDTTSLIRLLVEGGNSPATLSGPARQQMPRYADTLSDAEIARVLTYVRSAWGNHAQPVTGNDVASLRHELHK